MKARVTTVISIFSAMLAFAAVPAAAQTFTLTARLYNRSRRPISPVDIRLNLPEGWKAEEIKRDLKDLAAGESGSVRFRVTVPGNAEYTRPYWHRDNTQEAIYTIDKPRYVTLPLPPPPVLAVAAYSLAGAAGEISSVATRVLSVSNAIAMRSSISLACSRSSA